jgi:hypothetical protein
MGQLRDRMEQDLKLKGVSPATIRNYLLYGRKFAAFYMRSPKELGASEIRAFLLHQIEVEQLAYASYRQVYAALDVDEAAHDASEAPLVGVRGIGVVPARSAAGGILSLWSSRLHTFCVGVA